MNPNPPLPPRLHDKPIPLPQTQTPYLHSLLSRFLLKYLESCIHNHKHDQATSINVVVIIIKLSLSCHHNFTTMALESTFSFSPLFHSSFTLSHFFLYGWLCANQSWCFMLLSYYIRVTGFFNSLLELDFIYFIMWLQSLLLKLCVTISMPKYSLF